jgi:DNA-binding XRE family transcriptional regulator
MVNEEKLDHLISEVSGIKKALTKLTDVHITRAELARRCGVSDQTITNYSNLKVNPLPQLENDKYALLDCIDWIYKSPISETLKGQALIKLIEEKTKEK